MSESNAESKSPKRVPGAWKGKVWISPDIETPDPDMEASISAPIEPTLTMTEAHVLNEIADDYEEIGQIMSQLSPELAIAREDAYAALVHLVEAGFANAYDLFVSQEPLTTPPDPETHYFYITPRGIEILSALPEEWFPLISED